MLAEFDYAAPDTVSGAVAALAATVGSRPLAGGQGLLATMRLGRENPSLLVDLRRIGGLREIIELAGGLRIGALVTLAELAGHSALAGGHAALVQAAGSTGDVQVRNRATVGGSLATRYAASDLGAVLVMAGASVTVAGPAGERVLSVEQFYGTPGPVLARHELITWVELPAPAAGLSTWYEKLADRATGQPVCGVAAAVSVRADGVLDTVRLAVSGATYRPTRLAEAEQALAGTAAPVAASGLPVGPDHGFVDDARASAGYRAHLTRVLASRAVNRAAAGG